LIRDCYNQRAQNLEYNRLSFCLLGVGNSSDLIKDQEKTSLNIGYAINLNPFTIEQAEFLLNQGLTTKINNKKEIIKEIFYWTGGQPFLTQKLCKLVVEKGEGNNPNVSELVQKYQIENWAFQDEPQHLRTIRDRLLKQEQRAGLLLGKYQEIWQKEAITTDGSKEQQELLSSGLIMKDDDKLKVSNPIYREIFNNHWIERELSKLRPYLEAMTAWFDSRCQDESRLLRGQALADALAWKKRNSFGASDHQFLEASQKLEKRETERALAIETEAKQKANKRIRIGSAILFISFIGTIILGVWANQSFQNLQKAQKILKLDRKSIKLEREANTAWQKFELAELDALLSAMEIGKRLQSLVKDNRSVEKYPAINPILTLQRILYNIREQNNIETNQRDIYTASFTPDGKYIATGYKDGKVIIWNLSGKQQFIFLAHEGPVTHMSLSPDGQLFATAGLDDTVKLWLLSGQQLAQFDRQDSVTSLSFTTDGKEIIVGNADGKIWLLPVPTLDKLLEEGCQWLEDYLRTHDKKLEACSEQ